MMIFPESGIWNLESGIWNLESGIWNLESGIWNLESGIWNLESGIWNLESGIWNLESGTPLGLRRSRVRCEIGMLVLALSEVLGQLDPIGSRYATDAVERVLAEAQAAGTSDVHFQPGADGMEVRW